MNITIDKVARILSFMFYFVLWPMKEAMTQKITIHIAKNIGEIPWETTFQ